MLTKKEATEKFGHVKLQFRDYYKCVFRFSGRHQQHLIIGYIDFSKYPYEKVSYRESYSEMDSMEIRDRYGNLVYQDGKDYDECPCVSDSPVCGIVQGFQVVIVRQDNITGLDYGLTMDEDRDTYSWRFPHHEATRFDGTESAIVAAHHHRILDSVDFRFVNENPPSPKTNWNPTGFEKPEEIRLVTGPNYKMFSCNGCEWAGPEMDLVRNVRNFPNIWYVCPKCNSREYDEIDEYKPSDHMIENLNKGDEVMIDTPTGKVIVRIHWFSKSRLNGWGFRTAKSSITFNQDDILSIRQSKTKWNVK